MTPTYLIMNIKIHDNQLREAAAKGIDEFFQVFIDAMRAQVGEELNAETMTQLTPEQITIWGYYILREEVMDGGFIQLIHNGYAPFFFQNPFAKAMRLWGLKDLCKLVYRAKDTYDALEDPSPLTAECSDEAFMALFEQYPMFDDLDDEFVEREEEFTAGICQYIDEHIDAFAEIIAD